MESNTTVTTPEAQTQSQLTATLQEDLYTAAKDSVVNAPFAVLITLIVMLGIISWLSSNLLKAARAELLPLLVNYVKASQEQAESSKRLGEKLNQSIEEGHGEIISTLDVIERKVIDIEAHIREVKASLR